MMKYGCGCREISQTPIEFKIEDHPQVHTNCGPILPSSNDCDLVRLQNKIICDFINIVKQLECGIQPDIEIILEEISLIFMNGCGYNVAKKMYSTDIEDDYFLRHNNFLSEFATQEEKNQVLLNLGIYEKIKDMITRDELTSGLDTKIGFVTPWQGKWYFGFATEEHYHQWLQTGDDNLIIGKWMAGDYVPVTHTIVFNNSEGDPVNDITVNDKFPFEFPTPTWNSDPTEHFAGWYINEEYTGDVYNAGSMMIAEKSMTFYAKWVKDPRIVTFYPNYGDNTPIVINCYQGDKIDLITINRQGYTFLSWNTESDGSGTVYHIGGNKLEVDNNIVLYAQWQINTYTVTFNFNYSGDPNIPSNQSRTVNYGTLINESFFPQSDYITNDGKIIRGWNVDPNGNGDNPTYIIQNITFYAQWEYGYKYKLTTSIPETEPDWSFSDGQQTILSQLEGWSEWKEQIYQYLIFPYDDSDDINHYFEHFDDYNSNLTDLYIKQDVNIPKIIVFRFDIIGMGGVWIGDSNQNNKVKIK